MTEHAPELPDLERTLQQARVRVAAARTVWAAWAREEARRATALSGRPADGDSEWSGLSVIDEALAHAQAELETALRLLGEVTS